MKFRRGDIIKLNFNPTKGHEQGKFEYRLANHKQREKLSVFLEKAPEDLVEQCAEYLSRLIKADI